jgi:integrase/recombinase XerD
MRDALAKQIRHFLDHLTVERDLSPRTVAAYRRDLERYAEFLREREITDGRRVDQDSVAAHVATLSGSTHGDGRPYLASSAVRALSSMRAFHRFLLREGHVPIDPTAPVVRPKASGALHEAPSVDDVARVLNAPDGSPKGLRDRAVLETLYGAGLRISELVGLDLDDVDLEEASVRVLGKGQRERNLPLGRFARDAISVYLRRVRPQFAASHSQSALFLNQRGGRLTRQGCAGILAEYARQAGIEKRISPHTFRHSFATHLLEGGADIRVVDELLGHSSVTTSQVYPMVTKEHLRKVYFTSHPRARGRRKVTA